MALAPISTLDTFRTWFTRTNDIIDQLNANVISNGVAVNGTFSVGTGGSFSIANLFSANATSIVLKGATVISGNVTVNSSANVINFAAGSLLLNTNTVVNNPLTINTALTIVGNTNVVGSSTRTGDASITGNVAVTGTLSVANGVLSIRNVTFASSNSTLAVTLASTPLNDYNPTGLTECQVLAATPNQDTIITGIQSPGITGSRMLFIQNMSGAYKLTFPSANTSSASGNRFKTIGDTPVDLMPGGLLVALWSSTANEWKLLNTAASLKDSVLTGNTLITGTLSVNGVTNFTNTGNVTFGTTLYIDFANSRVGVRTSNPTYDFQVAGNSYFGNATFAGVTSLVGITSSGDTSLGNAALSLTASSKNATFANTFTANSASESYVRQLRATMMTVENTLTTVNVGATGTVSTLNMTASGLTSTANLSATGKSTLSGSLVIPVGVNKYAT